MRIISAILKSMGILFGACLVVLGSIGIGITAYGLYLIPSYSGRYQAALSIASGFAGAAALVILILGCVVLSELIPKALLSEQRSVYISG